MAEFIGSVRPENGDPGGITAAYVPGTRSVRRAGARVIDSDPDRRVGSAAVVGRKTIVCTGSRPTRSRPRGGHPPVRRTVTQESIDATLSRAVAEGRTRVLLSDVHA